MFPKPKIAKKRALKNKRITEYIPCDIDKCEQPSVATHEIFYGKGKRQLSIKYKMQIKVCFEHHKEIHRTGELDEKLKSEWRIKFKEMYPGLDYYVIFENRFNAANK